MPRSYRNGVLSWPIIGDRHIATSRFEVTAMVGKTPPSELRNSPTGADADSTTTITSGRQTKDTVNGANGVRSTEALLNGSHSFTATATDNAGNTTTTSSVTATVTTGA